MNIQWRDAARHYLQVVAFCFAIAVLTTLIWPRRMYLVQVGYALTIGTITWAVIEFGRYFVDERHCHSDQSGGHGWPQGWRGLLLTAIGIGCGFFFGDRLGDMLLGDGVINSGRDNSISLAITVVAGVIASFYFHTRGKAAALSAKISETERAASESRLKLLQTQLEPHMLFNTLANLRVLIGIDPARAQHMLDHLIDYLRATLGASRASTHPLQTEFERIKDYLELMAVRMGPRLTYTLELPPELANHPVPTLLLQPLVENSIRHGLEPKVEGGSIKVGARREGDWLLLEVSDTGVGFKNASDNTPAPAGGFGVAQVRERLATVYGPRSAIESIVPPAEGTSTIIRLPYEIPQSP